MIRQKHFNEPTQKYTDRCYRCLEKIPDDADGIEWNIEIDNKSANIMVCPVCSDHMLDQIISEIDSAYIKPLERLRVN